MSAMPSPVTTEAVITATSVLTAPTSDRASTASRDSTRSRLVKIKTGRAPLSKARAKKRSIWRGEISRSRGTRTNTASMLAARA